MELRKRIALTIYVTQDLADYLKKSYAKKVLAGYNGTRQEFYNELLKKE